MISTESDNTFERFVLTTTKNKMRPVLFFSAQGKASILQTTVFEFETDRRGRYRMVFGFITTYVISAYDH